MSHLDLNIKKNIKIIIFIIVLLTIVLFIFEIQAYYFPLGNMNNTSLLAALKRDPNVNSSISNNNRNRLKESYSELRFDLDTEYKDIFDYLENSEYTERKFKTNDTNIGCYDMDGLVEDIKGIGNTCNTLAREVDDINAKQYTHTNGKQYSFAEICPVTSGQSRPIMCLYNKGNHIRTLNNQLSNIIDNVDKNHDLRLNRIDSAASYHIVDNNRLFNFPHIKTFNKYEQSRDMGIERRFNTEDQIDDLTLYAKQSSINIK